MIITISSQGDTLENLADPRFGRSQWFIKFDTQEKTWQAFENQAVFQRGGAGVSSAQFLIDNEVDVAISGSFGPNAYQTLSAAGIEMYTFNNNQQTVQEIIDAFQADELNKFN